MSEPMTIEEALSVISELVARDDVGIREAEASDVLTDALAKLSSPDYAVVKREAAERALEAAHTAGMGHALGRNYADDLLSQSRALLGLSDSEGT